MKKKLPLKVKEEMPIPSTIKAGEYHTMFKIGLLWILPFTLSAVLSCMMGKYRYIAFFTLTASVWRLMLRHLSKRMVEMRFSDNSIVVDNNEFFTNDIDSYYIASPLRRYFVLRLQMKNGKRIIYFVSVKYCDSIESFISKKAYSSKQTFDLFLSSLPTLFLLASATIGFLFFILMSKYDLLFQLIK